MPTDRTFRKHEALVGLRRVIKEDGQGRVAFSRLLPHAEVVHGFLDGRRGGGDFLLGFGGAGAGCEGGGVAEGVGGPDELACWGRVGCAGVRVLGGGFWGGHIQRMQSSSARGHNMALYRLLSPVGLRRNSMSAGRFLRQARRFVAVCLQLYCREADLGMRSDRLSASWTAMERSSFIWGVEDMFAFCCCIKFDESMD